MTIERYSAERFFSVFALALVASKILGELSQRIKQPAVLGELIAGLVLGGSVLAFVPSTPRELGYETFHLLGEVGVAILLFEIGLETDLRDLIRVGIFSTLVAIVGLILPFFLGFISVLAFEKLGVLSGFNPAFATLVAITVGATLTATSVGITARVLSDMNRLQSKEARIVLGAAVIDDVLGLIILAAVTGLIESAKEGTGGGISVSGVCIIALKAFGFFFAAILVGNLASRRLFDLVEKTKVRGVLLLSALSFAFILAFLAGLFGLAPIVGAFAAGLILARTNQFKTIEGQLKPVADVFTPIFFMMVGAAVDIGVFNPFISQNTHILIVAIVLFIVAVVGKLGSGLAVSKKGVRKGVIGIGMIPRGEVGLIFAQVGFNAGVFDSSLFSAITVMVMLTTFICPPLLKLTFCGGKTI
jgi:Na+:H+ antiporter